MIERMRRICAATSVLALSVALFVAVQGHAAKHETPIDPAALGILRNMTSYLAGLRGFGLETQNMLEEVLDSGQKIQHDFTAQVLIERPDKLRVERRGDLVDQLAVYDGRTFALHDRMRGYYAVTEAPADLDGLLHFLRDTLDLVPPSGDLVYADAYELLTSGLTSGFVVGKSVIDGVRCDHLAFRNPLVDWQIWIAEGDAPLPLKYVLTTRNDPAHPQYLVLMRDWNVETKHDPAVFVFTAPADGEKIEFIRMDSGRTAGD